MPRAVAVHGALGDAEASRYLLRRRFGAVVHLVHGFRDRAGELAEGAADMQGNVEPLAAAVDREMMAEFVGRRPAHRLHQPVIVGSLRRQIDPRAAGARGDRQRGGFADHVGDLLQ